jgi:hypothetical protein
MARDRTEYLRERARENEEQGICNACCKFPREPDRSRCADCLQYDLQKNAERRRKRLEARACTRCEKPVKTSMSLCSRCRARKRVERGLAAFCGCGERRARGHKGCLTCVAWLDGLPINGGRPHAGPAIIAELLREDGVGSDDMSQRVGVSKRAVLRIFSRLIAVGVVQREAESGSSRASFSLTREARKIKESRLTAGQDAPMLSAVR